MDAAAKLIESNGTIAEKLHLYKRIGDKQKLDNLLGSINPGESFELPILFEVKHEINIFNWSTIPFIDIDIEKSDICQIEIKLATYNIDWSLVSDYSRTNLQWIINYKSTEYFKLYSGINVSDSFLNTIAAATDLPNLSEFAKVLLNSRAADKLAKENKLIERAKNIEKQAAAEKRRRFEDECLFHFDLDFKELFSAAWILYNEAIKSSSRKDFAAAVNSSPFRSIMFSCHDQCVRTREDFDRVCNELYSDKNRRAWAVEFYGSSVSRPV